MSGNWHYPALAATVSIVAVFVEQFSIIVVWFISLMFLFYRRRIAALPLMLSLLSTIFFYFYIPQLDVMLNPVNQPLNERRILSGQIISPINQTSEMISFTFQEKASPFSIAITYFHSGQDELKPLVELQFGAECTIDTLIELPNTATNPGQFDYAKFLKTKGIAYEATLSNLDDVNCRKTAGILHYIFQFRMQLLSYIDHHISEDAAVWVRALVLGDDSGIDDTTIDLFQRWGLSHLLAISGLHVGLVISMLYFIFIKMNVTTKETAHWIMMLGLPVYAILAGGEPSVWRACLMTLLVIVIMKLKWRINTTDVISMIFLLLILVNNTIIYHVGFQFSFSVTFGLLLSRRVIARDESRIRQLLWISFVAQMTILPLQFYYFYTFQPLSLLLNVIIVPYFTLFVIPTMFILLITSPISLLQSFFDHLFVTIHSIFINFLEIIDHYFNYPFVIGPLSVLAILMYYLTFIRFMQFIERKKQATAFYYGFLLVVIFVSDASRPYFSPWGSVTMLDVGQGDAFVIEMPYRKGVIMIDAGATFSFNDQKATNSVFKQVIKPFLHAKGISSIDTIFISHEDTDHMGSIPFILHDFTVKSIIISDFYDQGNLPVSNSKINLYRVKRGDTIKMKNLVFHVLSPTNDKSSPNENSLVLYTELGGKKWLFTGDISKDEEAEIIHTYPNLTVDVLKIAHHGSQTSSDKQMLDQLKPDIGLISVGKNNTYGHPAREVIQLLESHDMSILRTDRHGAVQYHFKANKGTFFQVLP
ncbi:DNA internalization-related competence protein ComEC/Rec2 [Virgibacillus salexigens]|uniref:DNA internalization-related competence protein ComEC/Rec2 n=1 Tax=Virgibacillus salexigens TaxID=61016 RepID=UPI00190D4D8A|nr:DNA internalization-related competence protein ComEC/Rec2 [Virgibacillus salexigens]